MRSVGRLLRRGAHVAILRTNMAHTRFSPPTKGLEVLGRPQEICLASWVGSEAGYIPSFDDLRVMICGIGVCYLGTESADI